MKSFSIKLFTAQAVKTCLTSKGIYGDRLVLEGFGLSKPAAPNNTDKGRSLNRGVELHPMNL
jgi:OOP family OmpA-OmpF porin